MTNYKQFLEAELQPFKVQNFVLVPLDDKLQTVSREKVCYDFMRFSATSCLNGICGSVNVLRTLGNKFSSQVLNLANWIIGNNFENLVRGGNCRARSETRRKRCFKP
jgi:hypothetical protein